MLLADSFCGLINDLFSLLLELSDGLIRFSFVAKFVVTGQCAGCFFDSTFCDICFSAHNASPYMNAGLPAYWRAIRPGFTWF